MPRGCRLHSQKSSASSDADLLETAVHELLHALYFSDLLMEQYIDSSGNTLAPGNVFTTDYANRKAVKTPKVRMYQEREGQAAETP